MSKKLWVGVVGLVLLLAACSRGLQTAGEEGGDSVDRPAGRGLVAPEPGPVAADEGFAAGPRVGNDLPPLGPNVIKSADVRLEIKRNTLRDTVGDVTAIAGRYGGFVISTDVAGQKARSGVLVIRVPAERFEQALAELRGMGKVTREAVSGLDVGQEFVDLEARLRNWRAQEVVLLQLMDRATSVTETIRVQRELQQVQLEVERIRGRLRYLEDQTTMSTITVGLREGGVAADRPNTLERAWQRAVQTFLAIMTGAIVAAGAVLPFVLLILVGWIAFRVVRPRLGTIRTP
jgi:uncharacterized protein DUF4349